MSLIKAALKDMGLSDKGVPAAAGARRAISDAKNRLLSPDEWLKEEGGDFRSKKIAEAFRRYQDALRGNNALDFDDLLLKTPSSFSAHLPVLQYYRDRF